MSILDLDYGFDDGTKYQCFGSRSSTGRTPGATYVAKNPKGIPGPGAYNMMASKKPTYYKWNANRKDGERRIGFSAAAPRAKKGEAMPGVSDRRGEPGPGKYVSENHRLTTVLSNKQKIFGADSYFGSTSRDSRRAVAQASITLGPGAYTPDITTPTGQQRPHRRREGEEGEEGAEVGDVDADGRPSPRPATTGPRDARPPTSMFSSTQARFVPSPRRAPDVGYYTPEPTKLDRPTHRSAFVPSSKARGWDTRAKHKGLTSYAHIGPGAYHYQEGCIMRNTPSSKEAFKSGTSRFPLNYQDNYWTSSPGPGSYKKTTKSFFYDTDTMVPYS